MMSSFVLASGFTISSLALGPGFTRRFFLGGWAQTAVAQKSTAVKRIAARFSIFYLM
jgi:hypothetical protein